MPDKRALDARDGPAALTKRLAPYNDTDSAPDAILGSLKHPRMTGIPAGTSPYTASPPFQQPTPLCSFSFDEQRRLWQDDRCKRFYRGPPAYTNRHPVQTRAPAVFGADLNCAMDRYVQRDESVPEHLDALVAALQHRTETASAEVRDEVDQERRRAGVVTWRGIITKICTAYEQSAAARFADPLDLNAMMVDGTLYLEEHVSASARAEKQRKEADPTMKRFGYYGYAFESYCTVDDPAQVSRPRSNDGEPEGWSGDVNTNVQWCCVVKTKLGSNRLIIGGEVDAVLPSHGREEMVELKTSMQITSAHRNAAKAAVEQERFEKKLLKFFLQSYLLGIGKIVVGFRDFHGLLTTHQEFETLRIPRMVRAGQPVPGQFNAGGQPVMRERSVWEAKDTLGFGDQILSFIRDVVSKHTASSPPADDVKGKIEHAVFRVTFHAPFEHVEIRALSQSEVHDEVQDKRQSGDRVGFLPRRFYEFVRARARARHSEEE